MAMAPFLIRIKTGGGTLLEGVNFEVRTISICPLARLGLALRSASLSLVCLMSGYAFAQQNFAGAAPAGTGPVWNASLGYAFMAGAVRGSSTATTNGVLGSIGVDVTAHWGATLEASCGRSFANSSTQQSGFVASGLGGPVFYPSVANRRRVFLHALGGVTRINATFPINETRWVARFSPAFGGGIEQRVSSRFAIRIGGDYVRASFFNSSNRISPQNSIFVSVTALFSRTRFRTE
jgi:hypothetical protein